MLSKEEKLRFLNTLREDEEFRLAVAGLLGLNTILEELKKLRQDFQAHLELEEKRWEENNKRWEENDKKWEQVFKKLEEHSKLLEEHSKILEQHSKMLEEHRKVLEEHTKILQQHSKMLEEHSRQLQEQGKSLAELKVVIGSMGRRWGSDLERTVLEIYRQALETKGIKPENIAKFTYEDVEGKYYRRGAKIEVDIYMHNDTTILIEVKSRAELEDVEWFLDKAGIVEKIIGRKADKLIIVAVNIDKDAYERAQALGIDVVAGAVIE
ncbi:DUF3782 domain-containing protein [Thermofilum sp.]|jgi:hypothetical protein|uniref:PD-(D/E)XK nuclease family protein n=2 Tax=Thermofilum sp. TaxID=1961369 RepID=UPI002588955A|nr:DUF3782 domain-containing protein [Thermofilum sp.]